MRDSAEFQPDEQLYRRVASAHIVGGVIAVDAVEMPACSFNREQFSKPADVLTGPGQHVSFVTAGDLPERIRRDPPAKHYEFFLEDAPEADNAAHCEVRIRPAGEEFRPKVKSAVKQLARLKLVQKLKLLEM